MAKYRDRFKSQCSPICPFVPGESSDKRHYRRLTTNLDYADEVKKICQQNGIICTITNEGHHWQFRKAQPNSARQVDWWPSSAKLVYDKHWKNGKHVYDYKQVIKILQKTFCIKIKEVV